MAGITKTKQNHPSGEEKDHKGHQDYKIKPLTLFSHEKGSYYLPPSPQSDKQ